MLQRCLLSNAWLLRFSVSRLLQPLKARKNVYLTTWKPPWTFQKKKVKTIGKPFWEISENPCKIKKFVDFGENPKWTKWTTILQLSVIKKWRFLQLFSLLWDWTLQTCVTVLLDLGQLNTKKSEENNTWTFHALQRPLTFFKKVEFKPIPWTLFCVGFAKRNRNVHFKGTAFLASWKIAFVFIF